MQNTSTLRCWILPRGIHLRYVESSQYGVWYQSMHDMTLCRACSVLDGFIRSKFAATAGPFPDLRPAITQPYCRWSNRACPRLVVPLLSGGDGGDTTESHSLSKRGRDDNQHGLLGHYWELPCAHRSATPHRALSKREGLHRAARPRRSRRPSDPLLTRRPHANGFGVLIRREKSADLWDLRPWSGREDSNPWPTGWEAVVLPPRYFRLLPHCATQQMRLQGPGCQQRRPTRLTSQAHRHTIAS